MASQKEVVINVMHELLQEHMRRERDKKLAQEKARETLIKVAKKVFGSKRKSSGSSRNA